MQTLAHMLSCNKMMPSPLFSKYDIPCQDELVEDNLQIPTVFGPYESSLFNDETEYMFGCSSCSALGAMPPVAAENKSVEAVGVTGTGIEVEVENVPLDKDEEFSRTIMNPKNNLRPEVDEVWLQPIDFASEPSWHKKKQQKHMSDCSVPTQHPNKKRRDSMCMGNQPTKKENDRDNDVTSIPTLQIPSRKRKDVNGIDIQCPDKQKRKNRFKTREQYFEELCHTNAVDYIPSCDNETKQNTSKRRNAMLDACQVDNKSAAFMAKERKIEELCSKSGVAYIPAPHNESTWYTKKRRDQLFEACNVVDDKSAAFMAKERKIEELCSKSGVAYIPAPHNESTWYTKKRRDQLFEACNVDNKSAAFKIIEKELQEQCCRWGVKYQKYTQSESESQTKKRRDRMAEMCEENNAEDEYNGEEGIPIIRLEKSLDEAKEHMCKTMSPSLDEDGHRMHHAPVCIICDEFILGTEKICYLTKEQIVKHRNRLSVESYVEAHGRSLPQSLVEQYQVVGMEGMLLSPRAPCKDEKYMTCSFCKSGMKSCNANKDNPPKLSIANGFAIGSLPEVLKYKDEHGLEVMHDTTERSNGEKSSSISEILLTALSPIRPYAYIFAYYGGQHKSIRGSFQFYETDLNMMAGALKHLETANVTSNIYVVIAGAMTPKQKDIIKRKAVLNKQLFLHMLAWFKENHPGYEGVNMQCPEIPLIMDPDNQQNVDDEGDVKVEKKEEGAVYYFSSGSDPTKETSVYETSKKLAISLMKNQGAPTLTVHGGNYAKHKQVMQLENVMPRQFPYGSGGPILQRRTDISEEAILHHYLKLSLSQFMRGDFILLVNNMLNRISSYKSAVIKCRPIIDENGTAAGEEIAKLSIKDIEAAAKAENDGGETGLNQNSYASKFLKAITTSCRSMGHTKEAAQYARRKCFALQDYFGMHSLFFTISPDDECSFRIRLYANADKWVSCDVMFKNSS